MSDEKKYVCGEPLDMTSRVFLGEKVIHKESGNVYTVAGLIYNCAYKTPVFLFENYRAHYAPEDYCRVIPVEEQFEWVFENADNIPFKELSAEDMKKIVDAFLSYDQIVEELTLSKDWKPVEECATYVSGIYRVKRKVVATPLDIPWQHIKDVFKYAAMDKSGYVYLYENKPYIEEGDFAWYWETGTDYLNFTHHFNIQTDGIDWKRSLTKRPEGV